MSETNKRMKRFVVKIVFISAGVYAISTVSDMSMIGPVKIAKGK
jgi:hypothetical protein